MTSVRSLKKITAQTSLILAGVSPFILPLPNLHATASEATSTEQSAQTTPYHHAISAKKFNEGIDILRKANLLPSNVPPAKGRKVPYCSALKYLFDIQTNTINVSLRNEPEGARQASATLARAAKAMGIPPTYYYSNGTPSWDGTGGCKFF